MQFLGAVKSGLAGASMDAPIIRSYYGSPDSPKAAEVCLSSLETTRAVLSN